MIRSKRALTIAIASAFAWPAYTFSQQRGGVDAYEVQTPRSVNETGTGDDHNGGAARGEAPYDNGRQNTRGSYNGMHGNGTGGTPGTAGYGSASGGKDDARNRVDESTESTRSGGGGRM